MVDRWLTGLLCCALRVEAQAVLAGLQQRGLRARSVPSGPARGAWTCAVDGGTLGVIVSGRGAAPAAATSEFWASRTRCVVVCAALPATEPVGDEVIAADGDAELVAVLAARLRSGVPAIRPGRIATVAEMPLGPAARQSLAAAGVAAAAPEPDVWRAAAGAVGAGFLVCAGLVDAVTDAPAPVPAGHTGPPWWHTVTLWRRSARQADTARREAAFRAAADRSARAALAVLLGAVNPPPPGPGDRR